MYLLSHIEDYPQVKLAKFGYSPERKVENKLKNDAIFWATSWDLLSKYDDFKNFKKSLKSGQFGTLFLKNSF